MASKTRNFPPTARKLRKSREEGDVAKSRDFSGSVLVLMGIVSSLAGIKGAAGLMSGYWEKTFGPARDFQSNNMLVYVLELSSGLWKPITVLFLALCVTAFLAEAVQVGFTFSLKSLAFKLSRLSVAQGFLRLLGFRDAGLEQGIPLGLVKEISKTVLFFFVLAGTALAMSLKVWPAAFCMNCDSAGQLLDTAWYAASRVAGAVAGVYLLLGLIDLALERRARYSRLRMDIEELKQELRESEGNLEAKMLRRSMYQELAGQGLLQGIRRAKVLVVGGSHW